MILLRLRDLLPCFVLFLVLQNVCAAESNCKIINLMADYWHVVAASHGQGQERQVQKFRKALVAQHEDLYGKRGLGFDSVRFGNEVRRSHRASAGRFATPREPDQGEH
jgi:hypothetical protein